MPVYDYTYKTWEGVRRGPFFRWMAIPKFTYMEFFHGRVFIGLFILAWLQFGLRLTYLYILVNLDVLKTFGVSISAANLLEVDATFFKYMIDFQLPFCFLFAFMLGAGLISRDLKHSAMVLYAAKPISRWEYFFGKFSVLFVLVLSITWVQVVLLFFVQYLISADRSDWRVHFWTDYAWIPVASLIYSSIIGASLSLLILAASSMTKNGKYAGTAFAAYLMGTSIVAGFMKEIMGGDKRYFMISPLRCVSDIGFRLFGIEGGKDLSPAQAWIGLLAAWILAAFILYTNLNRAAHSTR